MGHHSLDMPQTWESDAEVWRVLEGARQAVVNSSKALKDWDHDITVHKDGLPASFIVAAPGQRVSIEVKGRIWNANGDTCIHQLLLVMDADIIAELSDGVPRRGQKIDRQVSFVAPSACGAYMLWKNTQLQYNMRDARRCLEQGIGGRVKSKYPTAFVGWVVVA